MSTTHDQLTEITTGIQRLSGAATTSPASHQVNGITVHTGQTDGLAWASASLGEGNRLIWRSPQRDNASLAAAAHAALMVAIERLTCWKAAQRIAAPLARLQVAQAGPYLTISATSPLLQPGTPVPPHIFDESTGVNVWHVIDVGDVAEQLPEFWLPEGLTAGQLRCNDVARIYLGGLALDPEVDLGEFDLAADILHALADDCLPDGVALGVDGTVSFTTRFVLSQWLPEGITSADLTEAERDALWMSHDADENIEGTLTGSVGDLVAALLAEREDIATLLLWLGIDPYGDPVRVA